MQISPAHCSIYTDRINDATSCIFSTQKISVEGQSLSRIWISHIQKVLKKRGGDRGVDRFEPVISHVRYKVSWNGKQVFNTGI